MKICYQNRSCRLNLTLFFRRNCYLTKERSLKFFTHYTRSSCEVECMSMITLRECGCVQFFMPRYQETKVCGVVDENCFRNVENVFIEHKEECNCLEACSRLSYDLNIHDYGLNFTQ